MSEIDGGELGVGERLPTGTVTLLLADVEGSTRLWESRPQEMAAAIASLDATLGLVVAAHDGVRPMEQGEGDSFVIAFTRASDALACALDLQRAPLAPIRLRVGLHTGEVQLRDDENYIGPTINRTARLRDLGHGGQTLLSGITSDLVVDRLPDEVWFTDLGSHELRDLPRAERVVQLCHNDLVNQFPPLRAANSVAVQSLPRQLTKFVGRVGQIAEIRAILGVDRLATLTGAGGAGKTRLAIETASLMANEFVDGIWYADLAPITHPGLVPVTAARALGLPDQPGRSAAEGLQRYIGDRVMLLVLDNCEHLLDACAALIETLTAGCPRLTVLATSREPIGIAGEVIWRVPSLSLDHEAIELFKDRARRARAEFIVTSENVAMVAEICRRLDGMPLAIELAAARVRSLSLGEIVDGLHDRFRLLTGGSRTAVRRQQALRASVDWSHALLTAPERTLFCRLAAFMGGFDLAAAQVVAAAGDVESHQVLDLLTLLVDKSLVTPDEVDGKTHYRLLETVRQYALEKLGESGDADAVRTRHRDYFTALATALDAPAHSGHREHLEQAVTEMDNLRAAFTWSQECGDTEAALQLACSLQPLWLGHSRVLEGLAWLDMALADVGGDAQMSVLRVRAFADNAMLLSWVGASDALELTERILTIARELGDPAVLTRALAARGSIIVYNAEAAQPYFAESADLARELGDLWRLSQVLGRQAHASMMVGDPVLTVRVAEEGVEIAELIGDRFTVRQCQWNLATVQLYSGRVDAAVTLLREAVVGAAAGHDVMSQVIHLLSLTFALAEHGDAPGAREAAELVGELSADLGEYYASASLPCMVFALLADGDGSAAWAVAKAALPALLNPMAGRMNLIWAADAALAAGSTDDARRLADDAVLQTRGWWKARALTARSRVALARGENSQAANDAHEALAIAAGIGVHLLIPDIFDCLARCALGTASHRDAARLLGAADAMRRAMGAVRLKVFDSDVDAAAAAVREALGHNDFDAAWAEGAALSNKEAIAYTQRGRGERKRPSSGWGSLTPAELDVARLVSDGMSNKDIATQLFVSPRTVQSHLTHVYTKLGLTSRVQLAQQASQRTAR